MLIAEVIMNKYLGPIVMFLLCSLPSLSQAAQGRPGPYLSIFVGSSIFNDAPVSNYDFSAATPFNEKIRFDPGISFGGTGGYDFGFMRLEGEFSQKWSAIDSIRSQTSAYGVHSVEGDLGVYAGMVNIFIDLHNDSRVTPYFGGGIGFATLSLSDTFGYVSNGTTIDYQMLYFASDDTVPAYQVGGGLEIGLNRHFSMDVGYRYFKTGEAHFDSYFPYSTSMHSENHNVTVGFRVKF